MTNNICLLSAQEQKLRIERLNPQTPMLIADNANLFYLTGRVFAGYIYLAPGTEPRYFVRRPCTLEGSNLTLIRKPEEIGIQVAELGLELSTMPYADALRLQAAFGAEKIVNISPAIMAARAVKTPAEIALLEADGVRQAEVYGHVPGMCEEGMTDVELLVEIEHRLRLGGCLGQFRVNGPSMELHMGNILVGDNADSPSPYDFAMGGAGQHPSLPVGASGEAIRPGKAVMVDVNGNFNGYMTDMTRTYAMGTLSPLALKAHACSVAICHRLAEMGRPGAEAKALYAAALEMAQEAGLADNFMGHRQHAGFIGHGVGIEINELPVIAPRSKHLLAQGNVIALEPKFVIPGVGAVGIENTYVCEPDGLRCITRFTEDIISL
jgi:Xaa-Pro aminopeptidase